MDRRELASRVWKLGSQSKMMGIWNRDIVPSLIWSMLGRKREATSIKPFDQAIVDMLQQVMHVVGIDLAEVQWS